MARANQSKATAKAHRINLLLSHVKFNQRNGRKGAPGPQNHNTSMQPSLPKLKRASGLMTKQRRKHQQAINNENGIEMYKDLSLAEILVGR